MRKTSNMLLAKAGVPPKIRQLFMRHSDIRLTMQTYDDTPLDELAQAVEGFQKLKLNS
jgi:integrase